LKLSLIFYLLITVKSTVVHITESFGFTDRLILILTI